MERLFFEPLNSYTFSLLQKILFKKISDLFLFLKVKMLHCYLAHEIYHSKVDSIQNVLQAIECHKERSLEDESEGPLRAHLGESLLLGQINFCVFPCLLQI